VIEAPVRVIAPHGEQQCRKQVAKPGDTSLRFMNHRDGESGWALRSFTRWCARPFHTAVRPSFPRHSRNKRGNGLWVRGRALLRTPLEHAGPTDGEVGHSCTH